MITPEKMDEWIREIEERPSSALNIVRYIASRLRHLAERNEELLADNIQLRTEKKVEEYETRIANLEYQLDLLKRQLGGEAAGAAPAVDLISLFVYNARGQILRVELDPARTGSRAVQAVGRLSPLTPSLPEEEAPLPEPRLLAASSNEELLLLFDSGRTVTMPAASIPLCDNPLDWTQAFLEEPRGAEELAAITPIGRMSLADCAVQASRRGFVKKMMRGAFESYVAKNFVGGGVNLPTDRTAGLALCAKDDRVVLVSQAGFLVTVETARLPYTIEEIIRLSPTDHIVASFPMAQKSQVVFVTHTGKCINREAGWLEPAESFKSRGQPVFSEERRRSGTRLVAAAAVDENDWAAGLDSSGSLTLYPLSELLGAGALFSSPSPGHELLSFTTFSAPLNP